jgi:hypothetical protein
MCSSLLRVDTQEISFDLDGSRPVSHSNKSRGGKVKLFSDGRGRRVQVVETGMTRPTDLTLGIRGANHRRHLDESKQISIGDHFRFRGWHPEVVVACRGDVTASFDSIHC